MLNRSVCLYIYYYIYYVTCFDDICFVPTRFMQNRLTPDCLWHEILFVYSGSLYCLKTVYGMKSCLSTAEVCTVSKNNVKTSNIDT